MKNRLIGAICAAVMLLALFAPMAMADGVCSESVSWTLTDDGVLTVFGEGKMTDFAAGEAPWYAERGAVRKLRIFRLRTDRDRDIAAHAREHRRRCV